MAIWHALYFAALLALGMSPQTAEGASQKKEFRDSPRYRNHHGVRSPAGCWETRDTSKKLVSMVHLCLRRDGSIDGSAIDNGHGGDFIGRWDTRDQKLILRIKFN